MELAKKKVAILGLGIEGLALYDFLKDKGCSLTVLDQLSEDDLLSKATLDLKSTVTALLCDEKITRELGEKKLPDLTSFDIVFRSPSIYFLDPRLTKAKKHGIKISSQIGLFFELCPCPIIGVTGTKGKGTTASLIYEIIKANGRKVHLAGNIGYPAVTLIPKLAKDDIVVLELSNFQLADLERSPHIAVFTNLGVDHLDYHHNITEYREAKFNILKWQEQKDFAVINADSTFSKDKLSLLKSQIIYFSKTDGDKAAIIENGKVILDPMKRKLEICDEKDIKLVGRHNLENIAAAAIVADILKIDIDKTKETIRNFQGLPHRLEPVAEIDGIKFINDSFATNPGPTIAAVLSFSQDKIMILGGSEKGADFTEMAEIIAKNNVKAVVLIGIEGPKIFQALKDTNYDGEIIDGSKEMDQIVAQAKSMAESGDIVIFSPACASFDMFKNYKDRGEKFKEAVHKLETRKG